MRLRTTETEKGIRIEIFGDQKAAVVIKEDKEERILLPIKNKQAETTYYYEDSSGLAKTEKGYIGFYSGNPDQVKLLN
ncbi:hypothetical protein HRED_04233 [Candidatus Haloredivivus sp. G17]|jgi:hypothetical protein|nr:hypothetical protein HRED_04233 [Candidatus Haloredivivus sp. G17]